jgi:RNA polymerase sigma-70 factor (ECF subfamily)
MAPEPSSHDLNSGETMSRIPELDNEQVLISSAKAGDFTSFEKLVVRYERRIFRLAWRITQNHEDAEEVMQDAFLKSFQHLGDFRENSRFYTWLVRITVNQAISKLRRRRPNQVSLDDPVETEEDLLPRDVQDWGPTPEQRYGRRELELILSDVIAELDAPLRIVFQLRDVEGLSINETAELLGLSAPAVRTRLFRARLKLRKKLNKYFRQETITQSFPRNEPQPPCCGA